MEEALIAHLLADSGVAALAGTRVYPVLRPQGEPLPAITVTRITGGPGYTLEGSDELADSIAQVDCWAGTYADAKLLARAVKAAAAGVAGVQGVFIDAERDSVARPANENIFRTSIDLRVWHQA